MVTNKSLEWSDVTDNLGMIYIGTLFASGVIWAFIAINNFETPAIFKLSLIYSILLIFGFLGVSYDRRAQQLGLDSRIWEGTNIKRKLIISVVLFAVWYLVFISSGFSVASAYSVSGSLFSVSPALNFFLTAVLGPIAENVFFFGVINMTLIFMLRNLFSSNKAKSGSVVLAIVTLLTIPLFSNVPNASYLIGAAAGLTVLGGFLKSKAYEKHGSIFISALIIGGAIFPKFHSFAYQLNEQSYFAAQVFGIGVSMLTAYVGLLPVDILHIGNNAAVAVGLG